MQLNRITLGSLGRSGGRNGGLGSSLTTSNGSFGELGSSKLLHVCNTVLLGCMGTAINVYTFSIDGFARMAEVDHLEHQGFLRTISIAPTNIRMNVTYVLSSRPFAG
jgi:hypothetical protein